MTTRAARPGLSARAFGAAWRPLLAIGRDPGGGYRRYAWSAPELACREWFTAAAAARNLTVESDGNGNLWAWLGDPGTGGAVVTGSHFDSVPDGGGYDGALGVASGFLALDVLAARNARPLRPIAVAAFVEEEGSRFGVACLGSRLLIGALEPTRAAGLPDREGITLAQAMTAAGADTNRLGPDPGRLDRIAAFVELHIEQGRSLVDTGAPVGLGTGIWPHGRWRLEITGEGNHAGTTRMSDRRDPMLTFAYTVLAANKEARLSGGHATVGRVSVTPNATNAIPSTVTAWLDLRAPDQSALDGLIAMVRARAGDRAGRDGTGVSLTAESATPATRFSGPLLDRMSTVLDGPPVLATAAGHDAGTLAPRVPTAMIFVRNPTGVSHAPAESATEADCAAGVTALADVLEDLACT